MDSSVKTKESDLRRRLRHFLSDKKAGRLDRHQVVSSLKNIGKRSFIFGGTLRDVVLNTPWIFTRDIDLVVSDIEIDELELKLGSYRCIKNRFGGIRIIHNGHVFDIWPLKDTWAFKNYPLFGGDLYDLPKTTFLNIEAIVIELNPDPGKPRRIIEHGFFEAVAKKTIEINFEPNPSPDHAIIRALAMAQKTNFKLGPSVLAYIANHGKYYEPEELYDIQCKHYKCAIFDVTQIHDLIRKLEKHYQANRRCPFVLPKFRQTSFSDLEKASK